MALSQSAVSELLEAFRAGEGVDLIRESVRLVLQELIEAEATERDRRRPLRAHRRPGSPTATGPGRGCWRPRPAMSSCGSRSCARARSSRSILEPRRRIDQALYAVVMEAYVHGVSTRAVDDLVAALGVDVGDLQVRGVADLRRPRRGRRRVPHPPPGPHRVPLRLPRRHLPARPQQRRRRSPRWPSWSPPGSPPTATGRSSASTSATARTRCSGAASCAP